MTQAAIDKLNRIIELLDEIQGELDSSQTVDSIMIQDLARNMKEDLEDEQRRDIEASAARTEGD